MRGIKKLYGVAILLAIVIGMPAHLYAAGGNIDAELPSNDGTDAFQVKDSLGIPLLRVGSGGKVGIGTALPNMKLEVRTATDGIATSGSTALGGLRIRGAIFANTVLDIGIGAGGIGNNTWLQATDATDLSQQYILSLNPNGGNVGIGTTNPGAKLQVEGHAIFSSTDLYGYAQYRSQDIFVPGAPTEYKWVQIPYYEGAPFRFNVYRSVHEDGSWYGQLAATISSTTGSWGSLDGNVFVQVEKAEYPVFLLAEFGYLENAGNVADNGIYLKLLAGRNYHFYGAPGGIQVKDFNAVTTFVSKWSKALPFDINTVSGASTMTGGRSGGLFVLGNGNVGIGTAVPSAKLDVAG